MKNLKIEKSWRISVAAHQTEGALLPIRRSDHKWVACQLSSPSWRLSPAVHKNTKRQKYKKTKRQKWLPCQLSSASKRVPPLAVHKNTKRKCTTRVSHPPTSSAEFHFYKRLYSDSKIWTSKNITDLSGNR